MQLQETITLMEAAYRQWPHMEPDRLLAEIWQTAMADTTFDQAITALAEVLKEAEFPPTVAQILKMINEGGSSGAAAALVAAKTLVSRGCWHPAFGQGGTPDDFPSQIAYEAFKATGPSPWRDLNAEAAGRVYMSHYKRLSTGQQVDDRPQLGGNGDDRIVIDLW